MGVMVKRRVSRIGRSRAVTLPLAWCDYYGDRVRNVTIIGSSLLIIAPAGLEEEAERLARSIEHNSIGHNEGGGG